MGNFLASLAMRGVGLAGTVVVACSVVRGVIRAARVAVRGDPKGAVEEAIAAGAAASLAEDLDRVARDLAGPIRFRTGDRGAG
ncbi:MAG: hypothetical protein LC745_05720 [Planctomycetia bacterium]|nr:hypothetical protein [Planctomycetia bacterium]